MNKRKICFIIFTILILSTYSIKAQTKHCFEHYLEFKDSEKGSLLLGIENFNFVHNNEYESKFTNGTTWIGNIVSPMIYYYPSSKIRITSGLRLQKFSGMDSFSQVEPIISIHYQVFKRLNIIIGNLNQDNNHNLSDAIYSTERFFTDKAQSGVQAKYIDRKVKIESWIDWDNFINSESITQEELSYGIVASRRMNSLQASNDFNIYGELFFTHKGGEVNSSTHSKKYRQTLGYFSGGMAYRKNFKLGFIKYIEFKATSYLFSDNSSTKEYIISDGHAFNPKLELGSKYGFVQLSYWNSYNYMADKGNQLYWSVSKTKIHYNMIKHRREMLTVNAYLEHELSDGILVSLDYKNYFDIRNAYYDFSIALYLRVKLNFLLNKVKQYR